MSAVKPLAALALLAWAALAVWHSVKPLPPGTHTASLAARLGESQVEVIDAASSRGAILARMDAAIDRAEQLVVLDQSSLARESAEHLLARRRLRPGLEVVLIVDPRAAAFGGPPAAHLAQLEAAGIVVARVRLERLRDPNPAYSSLWRLCLGWWSDPFDEAADALGVRSALRELNFKSDERRLLIADDGAGGWLALVGAAPNSDLALELRGALARAMLESELEIATWSTEDDRLPAVPAAEDRVMGSVDARFLTEGALASALIDGLDGARSGDRIDIEARALSYRPLIAAAVRAARNGAAERVLLDPGTAPNRVVAAELAREGAGHIEIRWSAAGRPPTTALALLRRGDDVSVRVGAADFTRLALADFDLEAAVELRLPARAAAARALAAHFAAQWSSAKAYATYADESQGDYWRYRWLEASGLARF